MEAVSSRKPLLQTRRVPFLAEAEEILRRMGEVIVLQPRDVNIPQTVRVVYMADAHAVILTDSRMGNYRKPYAEARVGDHSGTVVSAESYVGGETVMLKHFHRLFIELRTAEAECHRLAVDIPQRYLSSFGQRVVMGKGQHELLFADADALRIFRPAVAEADIRLSAFELFYDLGCRLHGGKLDIYPVVALVGVKITQHVRNDVHGEGNDIGDIYLSNKRSLLFGDSVCGGFDLAHNALRVGHECLAEARQSDPFVIAVEEGNVQLRFQLLDGVAEAGLGHKEFIRGFRKAAVSGESEKKEYLSGRHKMLGASFTHVIDAAS